MYVLRNANGDIVYGATDADRFARQAAKRASEAVTIDFVKPVAGAHS